MKHTLETIQNNPLEFTFVVNGSDWTFVTTGDTDGEIKDGVAPLMAYCKHDYDVIGWAVVDVCLESLEMITYKITEFYEPSIQYEAPYVYLTN